MYFVYMREHISKSVYMRMTEVLINYDIILTHFCLCILLFYTRVGLCILANLTICVFVCKIYYAGRQ